MYAVPYMFLPVMFENAGFPPTNIVSDFLLHLSVVNSNIGSYIKEPFLFPVLWPLVI